MRFLQKKNLEGILQGASRENSERISGEILEGTSVEIPESIPAGILGWISVWTPWTL